MTDRRTLLRGGVALAAAAAVTRPGPAGATGCAGLGGGTVSFVVPFSAGGGFDAYARLLEPHLERQLGVEVVVHNVGGAGGMIGTKAIRDARPDGRTIGIVNGTRLVIRSLIEGADIPDPLADLAILGELDAAGSVWVVAASSRHGSVEDLWSPGQTRRLVFGAADLSGEVLAETHVTSDLLGLEVSLVTGYGGTQPSILALLRGEIDLYALTAESALLAIAGGEVRPLLQLADRPLAEHPALADVPLLAGPDGLAVRRAVELGRLPDEARALADAVVALTMTRRPVVAPHALDPALAQCLEQAFMASATDPGFVADVAAAGRSLEVLPGAEAAARLRAIADAVRELRPILETARTLP